MKKIFLFIACIALFSTQLMNAQDGKVVDFTASLQTNHLWRGLVITDKPMAAVLTTFNPDKKGIFTFGFWGGTSFSNESDNTHYKEINYYLQYASHGFSIGLWDLFNTRGVKEPDIWNYDRKETGHLLDLRTSYKFSESLPLRLELDMLMYGSGDTELNDSGDDVKQRYSTYTQVSYDIHSDIVTVTPFIGAGFSLNGDTHLYGNGKHNFDIVNMGITAAKQVKIGNWNLPVSATTMWNPSTKYARVQLAVTLF